jgi:hypothetical protein
VADGSVLFVIDQIAYPESESESAKTMTVDLSSIPTLKLSTGNVLAFLLCSPHISIQAYRVRAPGNGTLILEEPQQSPENIDFYQTNYLISLISRGLPKSGPTTSDYQVGSDMMVKLVFGAGAQISNPHFIRPYDHIPPAPLTNITAVYTQIIKSAMKIFLSGGIAKEHVPGGRTTEQTIFTSSLGHVIASAILFAFLTITLVAAQFRKGRVPFTLVNVAAALADSDVLQKSVEMTQLKAGTGERKVLKLVPGGDGRLYCIFESVD